MIKGIGIDVVSNKRIRLVLERWGDRFLRKVFNEEELNFILPYVNRVETVASRWALKEAVIKAVGNIGFKDIRILGNHKNVRVEVEGIEGVIFFSMSHERDFSIAVAVWI
ncbi:MAG: holo-ACP synthase [candidate division WOR-3 bacterium]